MTPTITRLSSQPHNLPLKSALSWGKGHRLERLNHVLVRVELSDGAVGIAEAPPRPSIYGETPESIAAIIAQDCSDLLIGQPVGSLADIQAAWQRLSLVKANNTAKGALDMALHMALAQSSGQSLASLLNVTRERVRVSFILGTGSDEVVLDEARWVYEAGVRVLKVKVGKDVAREKAQIAQIRQRYPEMDLYADANQCYSAEEARRYLPELAELGIQWCEEPLPVQQIAQRAALRAEGLMPLIADNSAFTQTDLERELAFDTFDVLNIKTARNGFTEAAAMAAQATATGKGLMVGSQAGSLLGCLHALTFAGRAEVEYPTEGTFFLKVDETYDLSIHDGTILMADVEAQLHEAAISATIQA